MNLNNEKILLNPVYTGKRMKILTNHIPVMIKRTKFPRCVEINSSVMNNDKTANMSQISPMRLLEV